jgi:UDP-glucose 4-epimerase
MYLDFTVKKILLIKYNMEKTILITGVAGLLGSRFSDWVIENKSEYKIIGIDNLSGGYIENIHPNVIFYNLDLVGDIDELKNLFTTYKPTYVYHFAAYAAEGLSPFIRSFNYDNNLKATANIVNECIRNEVKRLVFTSTLAVYGHGYGGVFNEDQIPKPIDPYGVAKYACEMDIQIAGEQHDLDWCIIRPHNVYGIKQNIWDKYRNVLGIWMYQHLNNEPMTIFGDGTQTRAFSYIDDSLEPLWNSAILPQASKQIINLGGIEEYSINEANTILREVIGGSSIIYKEGRHEVKHSIPTWEKSINILGFEHKTNLHTGLTNMWKWAQEQPKRTRFVWSSYELDNKIYNFWK